MSKLIQIIKRGLRYIVSGVPTVYTTAKVYYLQPNQLLKGKKIVVTGGGRGLGRAMAKKFISEGANVLIAGRNESTLMATAKDLGCKYQIIDVSDTSSFATFIGNAKEQLGGLDMLVNNAGVSFHEATFFDVNEDGWDKQFATNLKGAFFLTQEFIRQTQDLSSAVMRKVLFVSSETGETVDERPYGLSKAAMNSMVQGLASRFAEKGYRINAVAPGITTSDMTGGKADGNLTLECNMTKRYYLPEEVAEVACFLLSDASNVLNGQILVCNEGRTINARWK